MPLTAGTRLGPYEILAPLGAGGMGEVYRARDTRLSRDVAVKALPAEFAQDPERLARFEREAKLLASLSHPNIAAIHGLEAVAGAHAPWRGCASTDRTGIVCSCSLLLSPGGESCAFTYASMLTELFLARGLS